MQKCHCGSFVPCEWLQLKYPVCLWVHVCTVYCQTDEGNVCVCVCMNEEGATKLNVGELGAHSLVDLVGIKMKRNVSKL